MELQSEKMSKAFEEKERAFGGQISSLREQLISRDSEVGKLSTSLEQKVSDME